MKKVITIIAVIAMSMMVYSCKNTNKCADCSGEATECCCGDHAEGECTKSEEEMCEKCKAAAEAAKAECGECGECAEGGCAEGEHCGNCENK